MKLVPLTQGFFAKVDDEDFELASKYKWRLHRNRSGNLYAIAHGPRNHYKRDEFKLHRLIMGVTDPKIQIDHKDNDGLNCQKDNLRICTNRENSRNKFYIRSKSGFKGVHSRGRVVISKPYAACIVVNKKNIYLGFFKDPVEAAKCYDRKALEIFGDFANTNFPRENYE
jgi:hypothetical protein